MTKIGITLLWMNVGGVEIALMRLISAMRKTGRYAFKLLVTKPITSPRCLEFLEKESVEVVKISELQKGFFARLRLSREIGVALSDCDILFDFSGDEFRHVIGRFKGPKYFWWHFSFERFRSHMRSSFKKNVKPYTGFVMISEYFAREFAKVYPSTSLKTATIYNLFDPEEVRAAAERGPCHLTSRPYFVSPSRLWWDKDNETILRAFKSFNERHPEKAELVFVGKGSEEEKLKAIAAELGISELVSFKGGMDNPYSVVKSSIASILSSPQEGMPLVPLEAMALGVLPICSDVPDGVREELLNGEAGILFPYKDVEALSLAMEKAFVGGEDIARMKAKGAESLLRFSADEILPRLEGFLA